MRLIIGASLAAAFVAYGLFAYVTLDRRVDDLQIQSMVEDTVTAVNKQDLGGTIRCVSENYKDSEGLSRDRLRMIVAQAFRADPGFRVSAKIVETNVARDTAVVPVHAVIKDRLGQKIFDKTLVLQMRKEKARHMWILPTRAWRVTGITNEGWLDRAITSM